MDTIQVNEVEVFDDTLVIVAPHAVTAQHSHILVNKGLPPTFVPSYVEFIAPGEPQNGWITLHHMNLISFRKNVLNTPSPLINVGLSPASNLYDALNSADPIFQRLLVRGAVGSGKTTIAFYYAQKYFQQFPDSHILWISLETLKYLLFAQGRIYVIPFSLDELASLKSLRGFTFSDPDISAKKAKIPFSPVIAIIDGVKTSNINSLTVPNWQDDVASIVILTSEAINHFTVKHLYRYQVDPWSKDMYSTLCQDKEFFGQILVNLGGNPKKTDYTDAEKQRLVDYKYFYVGSSARLMFEFNVRQVEDELNKAMEEIHDKIAFMKRDVRIGSPLPTTHC